MGQKVNPHGLRVGVIKDWDSKWYAEKDFADNLVEDHEIRTFLKKRLYSAGISRIEIERASDRVMRTTSRVPICVSVFIVPISRITRMYLIFVFLRRK